MTRAEQISPRKAVPREVQEFRAFHCVRVILRGIELIRMFGKGQVKNQSETPLCAVQKLHSSFL